MAYKRVYFQSFLDWFYKNWVTTGISVSTPLIVGIFFYLAALGSIDITGHSGDVTCLGTLEDPCYIYLNFTAKEDVYIYPLWYDPWKRDNVGIDFEPRLKSWTLQRSWNYYPYDEINGDNDWRTIDLNKTWSVKTKYAVKFSKDKDYQVRIVAYKNHPADDIKWTFGTLDPLLIGVEEEDIVNSSKIVWEDDKTVCAYREYYVATDADYVTDLDSVMGCEGGNLQDLGTKLKEYYTDYKIKLNTTCEDVYDSINKSNVTECTTEQINVSFENYRWIEAKGYNFKSKQTYETRQCGKKLANLDIISCELHAPFLGYNLTNYTTVNSSGVNTTIYNYSNDTLIANYNFDIDGNDSTVNGNDLTESGTVNHDSMIVANGSYYPGSNDYFSASNPLIVTGTQTLMMWLNTTNSATFQVVFNNDQGSAGAKCGSRAFYNAGSVIFDIRNGAGAGEFLVVTDTQDSNSIDFWAMAYDNETPDLKLYKNGGLVDTDNTTSGTECVGPLNFRIGADALDDANELTGSVDQFIYLKGRASTIAEIVRHNNSGAGLPFEDFDIYGPFNSTGTFDIVTFQDDCADANINISRSKGSFAGLSGSGTHTFPSQGSGYFLRVDGTSCTWVDAAISNSSADTAPNITQQIPSNASTVASPVSFIVNVSDAEGIVNVSIYIDEILNITNTSGVNNANYTFVIEFGSSEDHNWTGEVCDTNSPTQCTNSTTRTFSTPLASSNFTILLNNLNANRSYEAGTLANLTLLTNSTNTYCLNITNSRFGDNFVCNSTSMNLSIQTDFLEYDTFIGGSSTLSLNLTAGATNVSFNVFEYDDLTEDLVMGINAITDVFDLIISLNGGVLFEFLGHIQGVSEIINFTSDGFTNKQLIFSQAGIETFGLNYTTFGKLTNTTNCTFQITGVTANDESFRQYEGFLDDKRIQNYTNDLSHTFMYDNFSDGNTESNFAEATFTSGSPGAFCTGNPSNYAYLPISIYQGTQQASCATPGNCGDTTTYTKTITATTHFDNTDVIDFADYDYIKIVYNYQNSANCNTDVSPSCANSAASGTGRTILSVRDSNAVLQTLIDVSTSISCGFSGDIRSASASATHTFEFNRTENATTFNVYKDGVLDTTFSVVAGRTYGIYLASLSTASVKAKGTSSSTGRNNIRSIEFGSIGLNFTGDSGGDFYNSTSNFTSTLLNTFSANVTSAFFTVNEFKPSGTTINHQISLDNGTTWNSALNNSLVTFSPGGANLKVRSQIDRVSSTNTDTPHIINYLLEVLKITPEDVAVDVGSDGIFEWNMTGPLNDTNSPQNVTYDCTAIEVDIISLCNKTIAPTCTNIPIDVKSSKGGLLNVSNINFSQDVSSLGFTKANFSSSITQNPTQLNITYNASLGLLDITNLSWGYVGNGNITVRMYNSSELTFTEKLIRVRYSDYNFSFPTNINFIEFLPKNPVEKNVQAYGQSFSRSIFNITTDNGVDNMNLSILINESFSCVNLTISTNASKSAGIILSQNNTWNDAFTNKADEFSTGLWWWADYSCNFTTWRLWDPAIYFRGCCVDCLCSEDLI